MWGGHVRLGRVRGEDLGDYNGTLRLDAGVGNGPVAGDGLSDGIMLRLERANTDISSKGVLIRLQHRYKHQMASIALEAGRCAADTRASGPLPLNKRGLNLCPGIRQKSFAQRGDTRSTSSQWKWPHIAHRHTFTPAV
jgi:hypothetical protein